MKKSKKTATQSKSKQKSISPPLRKKIKTSILKSDKKNRKPTQKTSLLTPEVILEPDQQNGGLNEPSLMNYAGKEWPLDLLPADYKAPFPQSKGSQKSLVVNKGLPTVTTDPITRYLAEIARYPLLTREQEEEVSKHYFETKDPRLAEVLVTANLRFVVKIAAEYTKFGSRLIDIIQEGNVGLMHAVKEFNPYKGVKLITYAVWWIRGYIQEYLMRQYSMVRIGTTQNQRKLFYQLQKEKKELDRLGEEQGLQLISGKLSIPPEEVEEMHQRLTSRDVSLSQPLKNNDSVQLLDRQIGDQGTEMDEMIDLKENLSHLISVLENIRPLLNPKELYILDQRLLADFPKTLQEIGQEWGVTREAVRQMENRLLGKLKDKMLEIQSTNPKETS